MWVLRVAGQFARFYRHDHLSCCHYLIVFLMEMINENLKHFYTYITKFIFNKSTILQLGLFFSIFNF